MLIQMVDEVEAVVVVVVLMATGSVVNVRETTLLEEPTASSAEHPRMSPAPLAGAMEASVEVEAVDLQVDSGVAEEA